MTDRYEKNHAARVDATWPLSILEAGNWREVYMGTKHMRLAVSYPYEAWERLMAALAALAAAQQQQQQQQPAEGEEIVVNTPYDVFTLPLRPSGLSSGPRFVVHVPGPKARGMVDGCHCATCTCNPGMTPAIRFDTSPAAQEGAIRDHLIALGWTPPGAQQPTNVDNLWVCAFCRATYRLDALCCDAQREFRAAQPGGSDNDR